MPGLVLIGCIPLGLDVSYEPGSLVIRGRVWFIPFRIGRKTGQKEGDGTGKAHASRYRHFSDWKSLKILLQNGYTILCRLVSRIRVKLLRLRFTAAGSDPANVAMVYGSAGIAMEGLSRICEQRVSCADLYVDVDFEGNEPRCLGRICMTMRLYQALDSAFRFGWGVLRDHQRLKKGSMNAHDKSAAGRHDGDRHG